MADYAIGLSFHKAHRTLIRAVGLTPPGRYFATRDSSGWITLPTLETGSTYIELQGAKQGNFSISDNDTEFRLLGDDGWNDSVITGSGVSVSVTTFFTKNSEIPAGSVLPIFKGDYEEGFNLIQRARYDKNYEIYIEFLKEMGQADGATGNWIYDFTGFNGVMSNYKEGMSAEGLTEVSFDLKSRGRPMFGRYDAGATALPIGAVQSSVLATAAGSGTRRYAVVPANNASAVAISASPTVTYTSDGTIALTQLALGQTDGSGFRLENASSGELVPAVVSLASNVVTINPVSDLAAATIFRLRVADGAITQAVDGSGTASPTGVKKGLAGFSTTFRTA
jgi:hypothetical protein